MRYLIPLLVAALSLAPVPSVAGQKWCPPGLAKKANGCMPPGQAKKRGYRGDDHHEEARRHRRDHDHDDDDDDDHDEAWHRHHDGHDRIDRRYERVDADAYGLPEPGPNEDYYRIDDRIVRVARDTLEVIAFVALVGTISRMVERRQQEAAAGRVFVEE